MNGERLICTHEEKGGTAIIRLEGELTSGSVVRLAEEFQHVRRPSLERVVLDLKSLTLMDTAGFSFLKASLNYFAGLGMQLHPCGLAPALSVVATAKGADRNLLDQWQKPATGGERESE